MTITAQLQQTAVRNLALRDTPVAKVRPPVGRATWIGAAFALGATALIIAYDAPYTPGSTLGYYLGLTGGLMMLALPLYTLRKSWALAFNWGPTKYWFRAHMILGIFGPLFVLFHSTFRLGSPNAAAALGSMLLVATSGIVGRFIYARIHSGLYGSLFNLEEMQAERDKSESKVRRLFDLVPAIEPLLEHYTALTLSRTANPLLRAWRFATLGWQAWRTWRKCRSHLLQTLKTQGRERHWTGEKLSSRYNAAEKLVRAYLAAAQRAAQFRAYDRLFSLWHVIHIPFVFLLAGSAIIHVIAVHMY